MKDITTDDLVKTLREGKLEGEVEFIGKVLVFSGTKASSLFLACHTDQKLSLTRLNNEKYRILSSAGEKKYFRLNFLMKNDWIDYNIRTGSIGMKIALPERENTSDDYYLRLEDLSRIRY